MRHVLRKIVFPITFLRVKHADNKYVYLLLPLLVTLIFFGLDHLERVRVLGNGGLIDKVAFLFSILTAFYIAALAAVATYAKPGLDEKMLGEPPTLEIVEFGQQEEVALTRRQYLCLLFGYLAFVGIVICIVGIAVNLFTFRFLDRGLLAILREVFLAIYVFACANVFAITAYGIYFLSYGIHRSTPTATPPGTAS